MSEKQMKLVERKANTLRLSNMKNTLFDSRYWFHLPTVQPYRNC